MEQYTETDWNPERIQTHANDCDQAEDVIGSAVAVKPGIKFVNALSTVELAAHAAAGVRSSVPKHIGLNERREAEEARAVTHNMWKTDVAATTIVFGLAPSAVKSACGTQGNFRLT